MATHLDLEEQEQLDQLKHFWNQYGNLITWALVALLAVYAGWNGWQWWQRDQAGQAGSLYGAVEEAARTGDVERVSRAFLDIKDRHAGTIFAAQAALLASKVQFEKGKPDEARATLQWAADNASDEEYRQIARLRLAGAQLDAQQFDDALKTLTGPFTGTFAALAADRRGDVMQAQGKTAEAITAYQQAHKDLPESVDYRSLVEAKLVALGAPPAASASAAN